MTGTPLVSTTKFQLATKGPETGHYLCSTRAVTLAHVCGKLVMMHWCWKVLRVLDGNRD